MALLDCRFTKSIGMFSGCVKDGVDLMSRLRAIGITVATGSVRPGKNTLRCDKGMAEFAWEIVFQQHLFSRGGPSTSYWST